MKTTSDLKLVIRINVDFLKSQSKETKRSVINKSLKEIKLYKDLLNYLETEPKEEFVVSEIKRLKKLINSKNSQFNYWQEQVCSQDIPIKKRRALFNKENEINKHKLQLKNLEILMN
jgi:hypothetical protein